MYVFFFSSRRRHTRFDCDWSSDVCSSDLLTSSLVLWLIFVSYLLLRRFAGAGSEMLAAAVGVFGMANVPFVYWSVNVWRTIHPTTNVVTSLAPGMRLPFYWCVFAFLCLYVALLLLRLRLEQGRVALEAIYAEIED